MIKKHFLCVMLSICILCTACTPSPAETSSTSNTYQLIYTWELQSNNHVGNNWKHVVMYNGDPIANGSYITGNAGAYICIQAKITEYDSISDFGSGSLRIPLTDGANNFIIITVKEGNGRYAGNSAKWKFSYTIKQQ